MPIPGLQFQPVSRRWSCTPHVTRNAQQAFSATRSSPAGSDASAPQPKVVQCPPALELRSALLPLPVVQSKGPRGHINTRISHSGHIAQQKGNTANIVVFWGSTSGGRTLTKPCLWGRRRQEGCVLGLCFSFQVFGALSANVPARICGTDPFQPIQVPAPSTTL